MEPDLSQATISEKSLIKIFKAENDKMKKEIKFLRSKSIISPVTIRKNSYRFNSREIKDSSKDYVKDYAKDYTKDYIVKEIIPLRILSSDCYYSAKDNNEMEKQITERSELEQSGVLSGRQSGGLSGRNSSRLSGRKSEINSGRQYEGKFSNLSREQRINKKRNSIIKQISDRRISKQGNGILNDISVKFKKDTDEILEDYKNNINSVLRRKKTSVFEEIYDPIKLDKTARTTFIKARGQFSPKKTNIKLFQDDMRAIKKTGKLHAEPVEECLEEFNDPTAFELAKNA